VTLALYRPEENRVAIAATHPHSLSHLPEIVIEPGAWVIGHVYASGRPVLVRDVRELPPPRNEASHYRTFSFAAVPVLAGADPIGVLTATDKRDGSAFDQVDVAALRSFSVPAALALQAAASDAEAQRLGHAATVDVLTGLFNRPYLDARLHQEVGRAKRLSSTMALLLIDVDDFKAINDSHGHQVGDGVLQALGAVLRSAVRVFDVCARYGGDEFAVLMPGSDRASAVACAERMRRRVAEPGSAAGGRRLPTVTISLGVAVIEPGDAPADLIRRADRSLYAAKAEGKNRVEADAALADDPRTPRAKPKTNEGA
jgi:diguanylate cyclase (GGDEF)-like protein